MTGATFHESCDVAGCDQDAVWCDVGECGDLWLCRDHTIAATTAEERKKK